MRLSRIIAVVAVTLVGLGALVAGTGAQQCAKGKLRFVEAQGQDKRIITP